MQSGDDVCDSVCDYVRDNPHISATAAAGDFKFCMHIESYACPSSRGGAPGYRGPPNGCCAPSTSRVTHTAMDCGHRRRHTHRLRIPSSFVQASK